MNNQEIAAILRAVAAAYEIKGEDLFRIRAYDTAADSVEHATREVKDLWEENQLESLAGIGKNIALHLNALFTTGKVKHFDLAFKDVPPAIFEFIDIPGLGPKTAYKLATSLKIVKAKDAVEKLEQAAEKGLIRNLEGFGEESEKSILKGIKERKRRENRMLLPLATRLSEELIEYMKKNRYVLRVDHLGSLRRRTATVGDIDLATVTENPQEVIKHFSSYPQIKQVVAAGENTARILLKSGYQVDIKTQSPDKYGSMLQHFTGSKNHNIHLREMAQKKGLSLSEHGIKKNGKQINFAKEEDFYRALNLDWIPPELREDAGEIEAAREHQLPDLVELNQIRGDLHIHTNYPWISSHDAGKDSIEAMVNKAIELGYDYLGVGDHNPSLSSYSQSDIISQISKRSNVMEQFISSLKTSTNQSIIYLLNTLEIDILADGKLAIPENGINRLDYAVVSIHSSMRMPKSKMTERILRGLAHPKAKILGHPTGRLLSSREGYEVDWEQLFRFMRKNYKILEINAWPTRLDLPDSLVRQAINSNLKLAINTDSHAREHMDLMRYGVDVAKRGWAKKSDIINTYPYNELQKILLAS